MRRFMKKSSKGNRESERAILGLASPLLHVTEMASRAAIDWSQKIRRIDFTIRVNYLEGESLKCIIRRIYFRALRRRSSHLRMVLSRQLR